MNKPMNTDVEVLFDQALRRVLRHTQLQNGACLVEDDDGVELLCISNPVLLRALKEGEAIGLTNLGESETVR